MEFTTESYYPTPEAEALFDWVETYVDHHRQDFEAAEAWVGAFQGDAPISRFEQAYQVFSHYPPVGRWMTKDDAHEIVWLTYVSAVRGADLDWPWEQWNGNPLLGRSMARCITLDDDREDWVTLVKAAKMLLDPGESLIPQTAGNGKPKWREPEQPTRSASLADMARMEWYGVKDARTIKKMAGRHEIRLRQISPRLFQGCQTDVQRIHPEAIDDCYPTDQ